MPFLPPNQQRQSTEGTTVLELIRELLFAFLNFGHLNGIFGLKFGIFTEMF